eukprot:1056685-Prymnesium_polylepis.1
MRLTLSAWLQRATVHLRYEMPTAQLPPAAIADAREQAERLEACLALEQPFVVRLDDATGESW